MSPRRCMLLVLASAALLAGLTWRLAARRSHARSTAPLEFEQPHIIPVVDGRARFDLEFQPDDRYTLIISSLDPAAKEHTISLEAERIEQIKHAPVERMEEPTAGKDVIPQWTVNDPPSSIPLNPTTTQHSHSITTREFYLHVTDGSLEDARNYARVTARLIGEGRQVRVYLDEQQSQRELTPGLVDEIVRLFDDEIQPRMLQLLGDYRDVDGDGKFTIFLTPWLSRLQGGNTSIGGFVRASDFQDDLPVPFGNRSDMLFLNSSVSPGRHLRSLIAHEYAHAVCFSLRQPSESNRFGRPRQEDWLNEAIAHVCENLHDAGYSNLDYRISRYLGSPEEFPLVVEDYYHSGRWRDHGCRGATYLFLRWCVDRYGPQILRRLARSPVSGVRSIEWATSRRFEDLFRDWSLAVWRSGRNANSTTHSGYTSLDLRQPIDDWNLAGPRPIRWQVNEHPVTLNVRGTSTVFVDVEVNRQAGAYRMALSADPNARLQVTVMRHDPSRPRLEIDMTQMTNVDAGDLSIVEVHLRGKSPSGLKIQTVSLEQHDGEERSTLLFEGEQLQSTQRGYSRHDALMRADYRIPWDPHPTLADHPVMVKVVAQDSRSRRVTAWARLQPDSTRPWRVAMVERSR